MILAIDQTKSLGKAHYSSMLDSIKDFVSMYSVGKDKTHIAIVSFAGRAKVRAHLNSPDASNAENLQSLLNRMKKDKLGSRTRTDKALELIFSDVLNSANGDRPNSPDVIVVFTDGRVHRTAKPYSQVIPQVSTKR